MFRQTTLATCANPALQNDRIHRDRPILATTQW